MNSHLIATSILLLLILINCDKPNKDKTISHFDKYENVSSDTLFVKANNLYDSQPDSALLFYTIVANRFESEQSEREKRMALKAALNRWELIFFNYFDYTSGFEALSQAENYASQLGIIEPRIELYTGHMFHTAYEQSLAEEPGHQAFDSFRLSLHQAAKNNDLEVMKMAFGNLVDISYSLNLLDSITSDVNLYHNISNRIKNKSESDFEDRYYQVLIHLSHNEIKQGMALLDSIEQELDVNNTRYRCAMRLVRAETLINIGNIPKALSELDSVGLLVSSNDLRDGKLAMYKLRADALKKSGKINEASEWYIRHLMLKDSLLNYQKMEQLSKRRFITHINSMEHNIDVLRSQRQLYLWIIIVITFATIVFGGMLLIIYRKNHNLSMANEALYRKTVETLRNDEEHRKSLVEKYHGSSLRDSAKEKLWKAVCSVLASSDEIYSVDFSLSRLCELCESKEKYVSQVINEQGENFSTLLNNHRIDEACRRIENPDKFGHLTLEGVGNSVGFKSANAFRSNFRQRTGLTPSQYQKQSRNNQK